MGKNSKRRRRLGQSAIVAVSDMPNVKYLLTM
jgi:ribosomal protein L35